MGSWTYLERTISAQLGFRACCLERGSEILFELGDFAFSQARLDFDGLMLAQPAFRQWLFGFGKHRSKIRARPQTTAAP